MDQNNGVDFEDFLIIEDMDGVEREYIVDAMIEMNQKDYIVYSNKNELLIGQLIQEDGEELLEDVADEEMQQLMDAYQKALEEEK